MDFFRSPLGCFGGGGFASGVLGADFGLSAGFLLDEADEDVDEADDDADDDDEDEDEDEEVDEADEDRSRLGDLRSISIGDRDGPTALSCAESSGSACPFGFKTFVSGSTASDSDSFRFVGVGGEGELLIVMLAGMDSTMYKLALFFVALVISLH